MAFHDTCSSRLYSSQEWELAQYFSQPILACHHLFASPRRFQPQTTARKWGEPDDSETTTPPLPFSGPRADYAAREAEKVNRAALQNIHAQLPPSLSRAFRSPEHIATDFLPYLVRLVSPDVKPVVLGGGGNDKFSSVASVRREGEKAMVRRAALVLAEVGIALHKGKIEADVSAGPVSRTQWVYRMEPYVTSIPSPTQLYQVGCVNECMIPLETSTPSQLTKAPAPTSSPCKRPPGMLCARSSIRNCKRPLPKRKMRPARHGCEQGAEA
jgi:hypothetical protein